MSEPAQNDPSCHLCWGSGLVEAIQWRWQADRWLPCPNDCEPPPLKRYTKYECHNPECGRSSLWTGALGYRRPGDHLCGACGTPWTELVDDGRRWKVEWEMGGPHDPGWRSVSKEHDSEQAARSQFEQLAEWERTGDELIRNVRLSEAHVVWREVG